MDTAGRHRGVRRLALASPVRRARLVPAGSALRTGVIAVAALAVLGFLLNDSGPLVIALALSFIGPLFALLLAEPAPATAAPTGGRTAQQAFSLRKAAPRRPDHPRI
jgi:hypothetical protein